MRLQRMAARALAMMIACSMLIQNAQVVYAEEPQSSQEAQTVQKSADEASEGEKTSGEEQKSTDEAAPADGNKAADEDTSADQDKSADKDPSADENKAVNDQKSTDEQKADETDADTEKDTPDNKDQSTRKDPNLVTYEFYDAEGNLVASQTVKKGDTLLEPAVPDMKDQMIFDGWYDADGQRYAGFGTVGEVAEDGQTVCLHAQYADALYLYYYDQYDNLIQSERVSPNSTVTVYPDAPLIQVEPLTQCQDGWSLTKDGTEDVSGELQIAEESVSLYPILKDGYWVSFETNSDTSIARQFVDYDAEGEDRKVQRPDTDPYKKGYVFDKWYADAALTQEYDFDTEVTAPMTLYAGYAPAEGTQYTVRYLVERQTEDGPEGTVGEGTWEYQMFARETKTGKTGDEAEYDADLAYSSKYGLNSYGFELNTELTKAPTISADGATVYNVYYQRKSYSLSISVPRADGTREKISFPSVKSGASMEHLWSMVFAIRPESELFDGTHRFTYAPRNGGVSFVESASSFSVMAEEDVAMTWSAMTANNSYAEYYVETLHGTAPIGKEVVRNQSLRKEGDERTYYLRTSTSFTSGMYGCVGVGNDEFEGFTFQPRHSDGHCAYYRKYGAYYVWFRYPYSPDVNLYWMMGEDGDRVAYNGKDMPLRLYLKRNTYTLTYHTDGGPEVDTAHILYEDDLGNYRPSSYVVGETTKTTDIQEFTFGGWYKDESLKEPFDFNATMPAYNLDIYAKWVPKTYTVRFDTGNGTPIADITEVAYGDTFARPADPTYDGHVFLGWTLNGRPYNMTDGVTDDITLVAVWRSIKAFQVTYDLNGGTGTAPTDNNQYYEDAGVTVASAAGIKAPAGKVFLGWRSSGDGKLYYPNGRAPMAYNGMTLTAVWGDKEQTTRLTYDYNYAQFGIKTSDETAYIVDALRNNSRVTLQDISALTKAPSGWTFKGWYLDAACTDGPYTQIMVDALNEAGNRVYARWERKPNPQPDNPDPSPNPDPETPDPQPNTPRRVTDPVDTTPDIPELIEWGSAGDEGTQQGEIPTLVEYGSAGSETVSATGDSSPIVIYGVIAAIAAAALVLLLAGRRARRR